MAARKGSQARSSLRNRSVGCLFWICLLAIIVAVGYAARGQISDTFTRLMGGRTPADSRQPAMHPEVSREPMRDANPPQEMSPDRQSTQNPVRSPSATTERVAATSRAPAAPQAEKPAIRKTRLFFLSVDPGGAITMKGVVRPIPQSDSPLRDTLEALLKGPTAQEINLGLLTMIPSGTTLRGVTVRGDIAYIDFSQSFRFNSLGLEGMRAQLRQVVYAATEFPTVKRVQVLIEGKKVDYLGTEGVRIDQPLTRSAF
ncbi:MAG TPA: GerMN domain-containing protein [Spirochaetia bacterium]|nr:GerMN domain-containing protein [Spirochaetia bacterium]